MTTPTIPGPPGMSAPRPSGRSGTSRPFGRPCARGKSRPCPRTTAASPWSRRTPDGGTSPRFPAVCRGWRTGASCCIPSASPPERSAWPPCAGCWRKWNWLAAGWTRGRWCPSGRCSPKRPPLWNRTFTTWPGRNSTSTPPSSWVKFYLAGWACPTARKRKPAGPPMPTCWKSCAMRPPSWGRCWNTDSTPS